MLCAGARGFEGLIAMTRTGHNSGVIVSAVSQIIFTLTQSQLLPRVRGQSEAQHRHGGDQEARHDQVEEVIHRPPPDLEDVGDVEIRLGAAVVDNFIALGGNSWEYRAESGGSHDVSGILNMDQLGNMKCM